MKVNGNTAYVPLSRPHKHLPRMYAMVDIDDYQRVMRHKWYAVASGLTWYAVATSDRGIPQHHMRMQNFIMRGHKGDRFDHQNGDGLDNRKDNLRPATAKQTKSPHVSFRFKGVSRSSSGKWFAQITVDGEPSHLGMFDSEEDAARAYDAAAAKHFGEFAKTNADNRNVCHRALGSKRAIPGSTTGESRETGASSRGSGGAGFL